MKKNGEGLKISIEASIQVQKMRMLLMNLLLTLIITLKFRIPSPTWCKDFWRNTEWYGNSTMSRKKIVLLHTVQLLKRQPSITVSDKVLNLMRVWCLRLKILMTNSTKK